MPRGHHHRAAHRAANAGPVPVDSLATYLHEIRAYPILRREEEAELARRFHAGDASALDALLCANLRFVVAIASKYRDRGVPLGDLIDEGNLGLIRAAEKFDETRGVKFISYAVWWIRQAMVQALSDHAQTFRVPLNRTGVLRRIRRRANELRHELGREPTQQELATGVDLDEAEVENTMAVARGYLSLDAPMGDGDETNLLEYLPDDDGRTTDEDAVAHGLAETMEEALEHLRGREAMVLRLYFGFDGHDPMTLEEIGIQLGVTRERVRQLKEKALSRLRRSREAKLLAPFRDR